MRAFNLILILEMWLLWYIVFHQDTTADILSFLVFYLSVFCGWVCFIFFNKSSVIIQSRKSGEIIRQVFIGNNLN